MESELGKLRSDKSAVEAQLQTVVDDQRKLTEAQMKLEQEKTAGQANFKQRLQQLESQNSQLLKRLEQADQ